MLQMVLVDGMAESVVLLMEIVSSLWHVAGFRIP